MKLGADFIVLNRCDSGLIERESRHAIRILDLEALKKKSPLSTLLSSVFAKRGDQQDVFGLAVERNVVSFNSADESNCVILPTSTLSHYGAEHTQTKIPPTKPNINLNTSALLTPISLFHERIESGVYFDKKSTPDKIDNWQRLLIEQQERRWGAASGSRIK